MLGIICVATNSDEELGSLEPLSHQFISPKELSSALFGEVHKMRKRVECGINKKKRQTLRSNLSLLGPRRSVESMKAAARTATAATNSTGSSTRNLLTSTWWIFDCTAERRADQICFSLVSFFKHQSDGAKKHAIISKCCC